MQQQISLCGVYFESLFDYMEQRSSKERWGLLASSMGLLVKGRALPIDMFFLTPPVAIIAPTATIDWSLTYSPSVLLTVVKTWKPTPTPYIGWYTNPINIFSPFYYLFLKGLSILLVSHNFV